MNMSPATITGYVVALPRSADPHQAIVAIMYNDEEYRILPRGAGSDIADEVNALVEATGLVEERDGVKYFAARAFKLMDEDSWAEE